jgi:hypothetical protein
MAILLLLLATLQPLASASHLEDFRAASELYAAGDYSKAAQMFGDLARTAPSTGAFHNLGNAEWKSGRKGEAVLAWERAQWLDPYGANTKANLRFARFKAQLPSPDLAWYEICSTWLPVQTWAWLACVSFWLALGMMILPGVRRWRKADWHQGLAAASLAVFLLTLPALLGVHTRSWMGVIRVGDAPLRLTPTREAQVLVRLAAGESARVERQRGQYLYVRAGNEAAGWLDNSEFGLIAAP